MTTKFTPPVPKKVDDLILDSRNPRIPEEKQSLLEEDLIAFVAQEYNAIAIAESIASHQYFSSEPLIAIPNKDDGRFVVVEGNRRLAALKLLLHPALREKLPNRHEWDAISTTNVPQEVPVVIVKTRREVAPIIGYRHISGIQPWDAYSKARYIAAQVEGGLSFKQTAVEVGEKISEVRSNYRNYRIAEQVADLGVDSEALSGMMNGFGIFTRAMQSGKLRDFIGAPSPDEVSTTKRPIPPKKRDALKELVGFLFGSRAVLDDSRDLTRLGKVLTSAEGLKVLRRERNLEEAHIASGGLRDRLIGRLADSARNLRAAKDDMPKYRKDAEVKKLIAECKEAIEDLEAIQK
jgi:hypothetical protein